MKIRRLRFPEKTFNAASLAVIGAAIVLIVAGVGYYVQQERQRAATDYQTAQTNKLILDIKKLGEQNKNLNQTSNNYAYCNAVLLSQYTQTHNAITIEDLDKCVLTSFPNGVNAPQQSSAIQGNTPTFNGAALQGGTITPQASGNTNTSNTTNNPPSSSPQQPASNSSPVLTVPDLLQLNAPCLNVLGAVRTCQ